MKRRFVDRVNVERKVIGIINNALNGVTLNGLSDNAIKKWKLNNSSVSEEIINLIENISKRARLDADSSKDVFLEDEISLNSSVNIYIEKLEQALGTK